MKGSIRSFMLAPQGIDAVPVRRWYWVLVDDSTAILDSGSAWTWVDALSMLRRTWWRRDRRWSPDRSSGSS